MFAAEKYWDWVKNNSVIKTKIAQHVDQKMKIKANPQIHPIEYLHHTA